MVDVMEGVGDVEDGWVLVRPSREVSGRAEGEARGARSRGAGEKM